MESKTAEERLRDQIELNKTLKIKALSDRDGDKSNMYQYAVQELQSVYHHILQPLCEQLAEKDKEIEGLKDEKNEALRLLNDALKLVHSLPDLLHDSLGECSEGNNYEIISINGERWINHKEVGSGEPLKQWIKSEIDKSLNK